MKTKRGSHELWQRLPADRIWYSCDLEQAGLHRVHLTNFKHWREIHAWCYDQFGNEYTWTGSSFWFCTSEDALEFTLTWC